MAVGGVNVGGTTVAPGLTAGRGLKQQFSTAIAEEVRVAPGLTAGRGLKHV